MLVWITLIRYLVYTLLKYRCFCVSGDGDAVVGGGVAHFVLSSFSSIRLLLLVLALLVLLNSPLDGEFAFLVGELFNFKLLSFNFTKSLFLMLVSFVFSFCFVVSWIDFEFWWFDFLLGEPPLPFLWSEFDNFFFVGVGFSLFSSS